MVEQIKLAKKVFDKGKYKKIIDTKFTQLINISTSNTSSIPSIDDFFSFYKELFFEIPQLGESNSHEYIVKTSGDYINIENSNEEIQALIDEVTQLRQENIDLNKKIATLPLPK